MTELLIIFGIMFVIFSIILFSDWVSKGKKKEDIGEGFIGLFGGMGIIISFCLGSILLGVIFVYFMDVGDWITKTFHIPVYILFLVPFIIVILMGLLEKYLRRKKNYEK